jgi:hypothetical protein
MMDGMKTPRLLIFSALIVASLYSAGCSRSAPPAAALPEQDGVYFITPRNGDTVTSPVVVRFGLKGKGVAPAGTNLPNTGHHHLLIDTTTLPPMDKPVPSDEHHVHFGGGQTETSVKLSPGQHTLQLVLGDHLHVPLGQAWVSERITVTVK